jgi:hypothetical protein
MRVWSGVNVGSRRRTRGPTPLQNREKTAKSRCEDQLSLPNQNCMRILSRYEGNQKGRGKKRNLGRGRLPPCDYRPCFDWHLQSTAYPSHTHAQMACEELEFPRLVKGAGIRRYHSSAPSRFFGHLTVWRKRGRIIVMRRPWKSSFGAWDYQEFPRGATHTRTHPNNPLVPLCLAADTK